MKILVTGTTGNVGRHIVDELLAAGHEVRALTRKPDQANFPEGTDVFGGISPTRPAWSQHCKGSTRSTSSSAPTHPPSSTCT